MYKERYLLKLEVVVEQVITHTWTTKSYVSTDTDENIYAKATERLKRIGSGEKTEEFFTFFNRAKHIDSSRDFPDSVKSVKKV